MTHARDSIVRFSLIQRVEHVAVMLTFTLLVVTGLPQRFFDWRAAQILIGWLGGVDAARFVHRASGVAFSALVIFHLGRLTLGTLRGRMALSLVPTRQDFRDAILNLKFYMGLTDDHARFDRFDYRQKFEYWGMVLGAVVVMATGLVLLYPASFTRWLPGEVIPASQVAHSNEGLMAFLVIIIWHIYNAHVSPEVFPFDSSIFTGRMSIERMKHEHPIELERIVAQQEDATRKIA
jgi:formate dehydrogenase subunit gamma